ncbi:MAG: N-acetylmuramoyl-L-alanine amidase [Lachnospiraceae bacterium]|jgi:N-acetylmuramoyl-L-alanine amidase|nr:N-acetylmuramoyl-L-alanine amidase [Lachnospiraceae bacterium]
MKSRKPLELCMGILLIAGALALSREVVQVVSRNQRAAKTIVVDAGHGGSDPGMVTEELKEKDLNLTIAKMLRTYLEKEGFYVEMTRTEDKGLYQEGSRNKKAQDMQNRVAFIAEKTPLLTVSIHQNSYPDPSVKGPQVFYYADSVEGEKLAGCIQSQMNDKLETEPPREAKGNTSYYLLKKSSGVLNIIECGFMTNPQEAGNLQEKGYQQKVVEAIGSGITDYLQGKEE